MDYRRIALLKEGVFDSRTFFPIGLVDKLVEQPKREPVPFQLEMENAFYRAALVHQVSDWCSGAAAYFGWMREAKRENTRCGL
jgi:hypothetical protein